MFYDNWEILNIGSGYARAKRVGDTDFLVTSEESNDVPQHTDCFIVISVYDIETGDYLMTFKVPNDESVTVNG